MPNIQQSREQLAIIYARRSSERQNEESCPQQIGICRDLAERMGFTVVRVFADEAISGKTDRRPEFQKMIRFVESGKCDVVIAYKSNRIARNMLQALTYENRFEKAGVRIIYAKEEFGDNAAGRFALRNMMNLNQFYSENMSEDIKRCLYSYAQDCKVLTGGMPFGYQKGEDGRYAIDPERAKTVKEIFYLYTAGVKSSAIVSILNGRGIRTMQGKRFSIGAVERILKNEKYIGVYKYGEIRIEGGVPRIIDDETFSVAQQKLAEAHRAPAASWGQQDYLLTGKLFCGHCGTPMVGETGTGRHGGKFSYYVCGKKKRNAKSCDKKRVRKDDIEKAVLTFTVQQALTDETINAVADAAIAIQNEQKYVSVREEQIRNLEDIQKRMRNIVTAIEEGHYNKVLGDQLDRLEAEAAELSAKIAEASYEQPIFTKEQMVKWLTGFKNRDHSSPEVSKQIVGLFVNAIYLFDDHFTIGYNFSSQEDTLPFSALEEAEAALDAGLGSQMSTFGPPYDCNANPVHVIGNTFVMRSAIL